MIYGIGLDSDKTYLQFLRCARDAGYDVVAVNLRAVANSPWSIAVPPESGASRLCLESDVIELRPDANYFVRLIDISSALPGLRAYAWRHLLGALSSFLEVAPGRIVNRPGAQTHNATKPLHEAWLRSAGFLVPPAVTSSSPTVLRGFVEEHGEVVVKALSGMRGIARLVQPSEFGSEFDPRTGPVHLQRRIRGHDVRAHVIGDQVFAVRIDSDAVDYRASDSEASYKGVDLSRSLHESLIAATASMGLALAGWDFKVDAVGTYWCLEVNPMPGYDMYDRHAGGAISQAILEYLEED